METRHSHNAVLFSYLQEVIVIAFCIIVVPLLYFATVGFAGNENVAIQSAVAPAAAVQAGEPIGSGDGRIHVIPTLSSPSVKNGGQLKIQALVKAVEGVKQVEALIKPAGGEAAQPVDIIQLKPARMNMGGVSRDATVGLWQAEWDAHGLGEGYYTVVLTVTDSTGHVFTDRSLRFSDPIAGNDTPGSTAYPNGGLRRLDAVTLNSQENYLTSAVIDTGAGYAYFGTGSWPSPGRVVKVALGAGANSPSCVGAVTLNSVEDRLYSAVIDPSAGYAYFGTWTSPGRVVKVALGVGASPPSRVGALTLNAGENLLTSAVIDPSAGYAYFGTYTSPGRVVKIDLSPFSRVGAVTLNAGEDYLLNSAVIDSTAGYAYFGTDTYSAVIDPTAGYAYFGTFTDPAGQVVKVALGAGASPPSRVSAVTLNAEEDSLLSVVIDPSAGYAYFGTGSYPGRVVRVGLCQKGFVKATRFTMPEPGAVTDVRFYSHDSAGTLRLAIYEEGAMKTLLWQSGQITNTVTNGFVLSPISAGTPTTLQLPAGTYWLAWQVDTTKNVASYTAGSSGDGFYALQSYGTFPAEIGSAALTTTSEVWTEYITYVTLTGIQDWKRY